MSRPSSSVRGVGRHRGGATDTTMHIWKTIEAHPGIDRAGIWQVIEYLIPEGYAWRRYESYLKTRNRETVGGLTVSISKARGLVLTDALKKFRVAHSVRWEGEGAARRYWVTRPLNYHGNVSAVDVSGEIAVNHMALADALRIARGFRDRTKTERRGNGKGGAAAFLSWAEYDAVCTMIDALSAT